jgi:hypothetical protein
MTQTGTRYGCFLPDLTGLARGLSAAGLPRALYSLIREKIDRAVDSAFPARRLVVGDHYSKEHSHAGASDHRRTTK